MAQDDGRNLRGFSLLIDTKVLTFQAPIGQRAVETLLNTLPRRTVAFRMALQYSIYRPQKRWGTKSPTIAPTNRRER